MALPVDLEPRLMYALVKMYWLQDFGVPSGSYCLIHKWMKVILR
jgi:hypothetical protein